MTSAELKKKRRSLAQSIRYAKRRYDSAMYEMQKLYDELPAEQRPMWFALVDDKYIGAITDVKLSKDSKGWSSLCVEIKTNPTDYGKEK